MIDSKTARRMAKAWRLGTPMTQAIVELRITNNDAWDMFRYNRDGELIARITDEDRQRTLGAHVYSPRILRLDQRY